MRQQLPYLSAGGRALWLSPVLKNLRFDDGSYHGYGIHDFLSAEPRFADNPDRADEELRGLVDAAHQEGIYVIFDIVLNHTGDVFDYQGPDSSAFHSEPQAVAWRDETGKARPDFPDIATIPVAKRSRDALVWPAELQQNRYFRRRQGTPSSDDTIGDFASLKQMLTADPDLQRF